VTTSSTVGRISQLEQSTLLKLQAGCNFINAEVEKRRQRVVIVSIVLAVIALMVYAWMWQNGQQDPRFPLGGAFVLISLYVARERSQLAKSYKSIVVTRVVKALGQGLSYSPTSTFTKQHFLDMDLFQKRCEQWKAEDQISGKCNAVGYSIFEAKATRTEGSGKNRRRVTIFRGLIIRLDFNKYFNGHTVIVPDSESKILGGLFGDSSERRSKELCRLESVEFENCFSVYSTDQQEARYILTPKLMELVMGARQVFSHDIRLSFHDNSVFVTVPQSTDRFEVRLFGPKITPEAAVGELAELVKLTERLVDTLDLETRIWTRV
jgi:Protein of unknown function (DUF3137)